MVKEAKVEAKVGVGVERLWKAMAKDCKFVIPKIMPNLVDSIDVVDGDGGVGSVLFFHFSPEVKTMRNQKEKIVELDETEHRFGLEVVDGIMLKKGFSYFKTTFQLASVGDEETLVDVKVVYETETTDEEADFEDKATTPALHFLQRLEKYLLETAS